MAFDIRPILIISTIIFFALFIVFLALWLETRTNRVNPKNCPTIASDYAVIPNVDPSTLKVQYTCTATPDGTIGNQICNFSGIDNLNQAINTCNLYTGEQGCETFLYNPVDSSFNIITPGYPISSSSNQTKYLNNNIYIRQSNN